MPDDDYSKPDHYRFVCNDCPVMSTKASDMIRHFDETGHIYSAQGVYK